MVDIHYCENCEEHEAEVRLASPGGETKYICTSPECMMAANMCPSCEVELEVKAGPDGEEMYSCPHCDFEHTYEDLGQA